MKIAKTGWVIVVVGFMMGCFSLGTGHAQDMSIWIGKWFKVTSQETGYAINPEDPSQMHKYSETATTYMKGRNWADKVLSFDSYDYDEEGGHWVKDEDGVLVHYFGGTNLNFVGYILDMPEEPGEVPTLMTLRFEGKMKGEELQNGSFASLGAADLWVGGLEIGAAKANGKLIPESQVPPEIR